MTARIEEGFALLAAGDRTSARRIAFAALEQSLTHAPGLHLLAVGQMHEGDFEAALESIELAITVAPDDVRLREAKASIQLRAGNDAAALQTLGHALALDPESVSVNVMLGDVLMRLSQPTAALESFKAALKASSGESLHAARGAAGALLRLKRPGDGLSYAEHALKLAPDDGDTLFLCGQLYCRNGQREEGVECYERVLAQMPDNPVVLRRLGETLYSTNRLADSISYMDRVLALDPGQPQALVSSATGRLLLARFNEEGIARRRLQQFAGAAAFNTRQAAEAAYNVPFLRLSRKVERRLWDKVAASIRTGTADEPAASPFVHAQRSSQRIRIGYVSPHLGNHAVGHVTCDIFACHDRERFEVFAYATADRASDRSLYKTRIEQSCDHMITLADASPRQLAQRFHDDRIDVLIDLCGYMVDTRIVEAFSFRPAPTQIYWIGHGGGLGLPWYDYIVGDGIVTPPADDAHYTERVLRMPHCFVPAPRHEISSEESSRQEQGLAEDGVVFCAFHAPTKIDSRVFATWMRILQRVPDSQLWLSRASSLRHAQVSSYLRASAEEAGVCGSRLVFARFEDDKAKHLARHRLADLLLDTFTVNAATTCLDALNAGLPVLTRPGRHFCSRIAASILHSAGLDELVVPSTDAYVSTAVALANDADRRVRLRSRIAAAYDDSPLFDTPAFVRDFERGLLRITGRTASAA